MQTDLAIIQGGDAALALLVSKTQDYIRQSLAANTLRAYASDWRDFTDWCKLTGRVPLPAISETVSLYLSGLAEHAKVSTLTRRISAISQAHQAAGFESPILSPLVSASS